MLPGDRLFTIPRPNGQWVVAGYAVKIVPDATLLRRRDATGPLDPDKPRRSA